jgi:hypothetical protein
MGEFSFKHYIEKGGWIGWDHMDSKSMQPGATPGLYAIEKQVGDKN